MFLPLTCLLLLAGLPSRSNGFVPVANHPTKLSRGSQAPSLTSLFSSPGGWKGDVVSNNGSGKIGGCTMEQVGDSLTEWIITIDGVEADLGRFSDAIYKKMMQDAKQQRFQGFRPGTVPAHVEPTYRAFAMDECARETVLEAMQQNNVRPFDNTRNELLMEDFRVPPPQNKKVKGKKGKKPKIEENSEDTAPLDEIPQWASFATMKEAISAGWRPGQSFSFVARNVKGQKVKEQSETDGATPLGLNF